MIVSIAGNIGSGKSTLIKKLHEKGYNVYEEPVHKWSLLPRFYTNMERWSFSLQVQILMSILEFPKNKVNIVERSPWESLKIFSQYAKDHSLFDPIEFCLLESLHDKLAWTPDLFIYLQCNPDVCIERIKHRGRECENDIDPQYVKDLHIYYEKEIIQEKNTLIINAEEDCDTVMNNVNICLMKYKNNDSKNSFFHLANDFYNIMCMVFRILYKKRNKYGKF